MRPLKKFNTKDKTLERDLNLTMEDIYKRLVFDSPADRTAYAALTTDAQRVAFIASKLGLI